MGLLTPADVREIAARIGVRPAKRLGQNFVIEQGTVRQIATLARVAPSPSAPSTSTTALASEPHRMVVTTSRSGAAGCHNHAPSEAGEADEAGAEHTSGVGEVVLEVGPGLGSLTLALVEAGAGRVIAVEIDRALADELPATLAAHAGQRARDVSVLHADALRIAAKDLPLPPRVLVANLPYNVAVPVLLHLLAELPSLERGLVMVQAEVADRLCAGPGSRVYGAPSVKLAWYATARLAGTVPRSVFWPVPNVDSKLVAFTRHEPPSADRERADRERADRERAVRERTFAVIDAAFGQRRKTLRAALANWAGGASEAERRLRAAGIDPGARGESLTVAEFARMAEGPGRQRTIGQS